MKYDVVVVGAGIVGLATAYQLLKKNPNLKVLVLEKESQVGQHQTGNNSGVIHSGVYYKPDSLKALNCSRGYALMVEFCEENKIPYEICGKVIVATEEKELPTLEKLFERGKANGLQGLKILDSKQTLEIEPHVNAIKSLYVPQAGIVDYSRVCVKLAEKINQWGGEIRLGEGFSSLDVSKNQVLTTAGQTLSFHQFVNCAGLYSDRVVSQDLEDINFRILPFRGEYYRLKPESEYLVSALIYPVPDIDMPFLGVHFTRMMSGGIEAGPNAVLALKREGYRWAQFSFREFWWTLSWPGFYRFAIQFWRIGIGEVLRSLFKPRFVKSLQKLIPKIQSSDLFREGAGVRAQVCLRNGDLVDDFLIKTRGNRTHVCNAPSPAATSSLSIGNTVAEGILKALGSNDHS